MASVQPSYLRELSERRLNEHVGQLANFGIAVGLVLALLGGFFWFCVVSSVDGLWCAMLVIGFVLMTLGLFLPESLRRPHRWWMTIAHWQGWLVMTVLLTLIYFVLIAPLGALLRRQRGTAPFFTWNKETSLTETTAWQPLPQSEPSPQNAARVGAASRDRRSLLKLLAATIGFFYGQGHYLMLPILIVLLALGLLLFFVQGSVLAPFIYTIF